MLNVQLQTLSPHMLGRPDLRQWLSCKKGLGKVLFVDEAYRLGEGQFAKEAIDELVDSLTKPQFFGKLVVILAGYTENMNKLLKVNPGLSSRFPEEIIIPEHVGGRVFDSSSTPIESCWN